MNRILVAISLFLLLPAIEIKAQDADTAEVEIELYVGDLLEIGQCKGSSFKHIEMHHKTRTAWDERNPGYDTSSGEGFYRWYFTEGDFDSQKLPCSYAGKRFPIVSMETFLDKETKEPREVIFIKLAQSTYAWVEFYPAIEGEEIKIVR